MKINTEIKGHLFALVSIIIWGTTYVSTKVLLSAFTPIEILVIRFVIGFIALLLIYPKVLKITSIKQELLFLGAGISGVTLYYLLENIALTYTSASNVGIIISIAPFFIGIFAYLFLKEEKLSVQFFLGFVIAILGITIISFNSAKQISINPFGDLLATLAAVAWASYSIFMKKISHYKINTIQVTQRIFFYGILFMIPATFTMQFEIKLATILTPIHFANFIFLGFGASAMCFVTWNTAVKIIGAIKSSVYIYMVPIITTISAILVLNEKINATTVIGILLTLLGLLISEFKKPCILKKLKELGT